METLNIFDNDKQELFEELTILATEGTDAYDPTITAALIHNTARSFAKAATILRETGPDIESGKQMLLQLWQASDTERSQQFNGMISSEHATEFQPLSHEEYEETIESLYQVAETAQDLEDITMDKYKLFLQTDTNILVGVIYGMDQVASEETEEELLEQGPGVLSLVEILEVIAHDLNEDYKKGYVDECALSKSFTDLGGELTSSFSFNAERRYVKNNDGEEEVVSEYNLNTNLVYRLNGLDSLPEYVYDFLEETIHEEETPFTEDDLIDETTIFVVQFENSVYITSDGYFRSVPSLYLLVNGFEFPLPEAPSTRGIDESKQTNEDEQELLDSIFSREEMTAFNSIIQESSQSIIESFHQKKASIMFVTTEKKLSMAHGIAKEFIKMGQKHS